MAKQYTIQKGDTLGAIAKKYGVGVGDITGYKSGNADLIYPGENINIGDAKPKSDTTVSDNSSYVNEVKNQLGSTAETTPKDTYGLEKIKTDVETAKKNREDAFTALKDISTTTFNDEYANRGLAEKKAKMTTLDSEIANEKATRDESIAKIRSNPGLSAAQMTGDIKKIADYQNDVINTKIAQRNALASDYNTTLGEIDKVVSNKVKDKSLDYDYYGNIVKDLTSSIGDYTKQYREDLQNTAETDYKDRALAQALEIAKMNAEGKNGDENLTLVTDKETNAPLYWYNKKTGKIIPIDDKKDTTSGDSYNELESQLSDETKDTGAKWYNPFTWFN